MAKPIRRHKLSAVISIGDTHVNHKFALMFPHKFTGDHKVRPTQWWMYKRYLEFVTLAEETIKDAKPDLTLLELGGDMGDIDAKKRSRTEFWSNKELTIAMNAAELLRPLAAIADVGLAIKGTRSHVGEDGSLDNHIAKLVSDQGLKFHQRTKDDYTWRTRVMDLSGALVHFQHKGKNPSKAAAENSLNLLRRDVVNDFKRARQPIPDILFRHHTHWFGTTSPFESPYIIQVGAWQLPYGFIAEIDPVGTARELNAVIQLIQNKKPVETIPFRVFIPQEVGKL